MSDIVAQMAGEMNLTGDMLTAMQQQQQMGMTGMPGMGGGMAGGMPDISQLSPEQQMAMMDAYNRQAAGVGSGQPMLQPDDASSVSSSSSSMSDTAGSWTDNIVSYLKAPVIVMVIFILFSLTQLDGVLKPLLPLILAGGLYFTALKGALAGLTFLLIRLVIN